MNFPPLDQNRFKMAKAFLCQEAERSYKYEVSFLLHGLEVTWRLNDQGLLQQLESYFPKEWKLKSVTDPYVIYWKNSFEESFWSSENPDCQIEQCQDGEIALQRDFAAFKKHDGSIDLHTRLLLDDGFYNFLRWLLPRLWIQKSRLLLHSSCVVDPKGFAHICLGVSGAGKSTIAGLAPKDWTVLGDDMNIVRVVDGQVVACPSAVGQAMESVKHFGKEFPIAGVYGLEQASQNLLSSQSLGAAYTKLASSCANLFWDSLSQRELLQVQELLLKVSSQVDYYNLAFKKEIGVWDYVANFR